MAHGAISFALQRRLDRPDIHKPVSRDQTSFGQDVHLMVKDLKEYVPELSIRQISTLVGVSKTFVTKALNTTVPLVEWSSDDNESSSAAHLAALHRFHPDRRYEDETERTVADEVSNVPVYFSAPVPVDIPRRIDQSHTLPRPITLATSPFSVAA
jgi:hypothetical protein